MWSLWRDDAGAGLRERALHLLQKSYPNLRWVWIVGDSTDGTLDELRGIAGEVQGQRRVDVLELNTGIEGDSPEDRRRRYGATINQWFEMLPDVEYVVQHESDLRSPLNLIEVFVSNAEVGRPRIAGWPILPYSDNSTVFYDIWAYRRDGQLFGHVPPYHPCYRENEPFEVDSVGSCWMFPADDIREGARFTDEAVLGLCKWLRAHGKQIWVEPRLTIVQPRELWISHPVAA
jgi:hypothetical protein